MECEKSSITGAIGIRTTQFQVELWICMMVFRLSKLNVWGGSRQLIDFSFIESRHRDAVAPLLASRNGALHRWGHRLRTSLWRFPWCGCVVFWNTTSGLLSGGPSGRLLTSILRVSLRDCQVHFDLRVNVCETNDSVDLANLNVFPTFHYVHCQTTYSKCAKVDWFKNKKSIFKPHIRKKNSNTATFLYKSSSACIELTVTVSSKLK